MVYKIRYLIALSNVERSLQHLWVHLPQAHAHHHALHYPSPTLCAYAWMKPPIRCSWRQKPKVSCNKEMLTLDFLLHLHLQVTRTIARGILKAETIPVRQRQNTTDQTKTFIFKHKLWSRHFPSLSGLCSSMPDLSEWTATNSLIAAFLISGTDYSSLANSEEELQPNSRIPHIPFDPLIYTLGRDSINLHIQNGEECKS